METQGQKLTAGEHRENSEKTRVKTYVYRKGRRERRGNLTSFLEPEPREKWWIYFSRKI